MPTIPIPAPPLADAPAAVPSLRTLGTGATQAAAGNDSRFGTVSIGGTVTSGTTGSVLFVGVAAALTQDNTNFFWDDTNNRLGIGTNAPSQKIHARQDQNGLTIVQVQNNNAAIGGNANAHAAFAASDGTNATYFLSWPLAHISSILQDTGGVTTSKPGGMAFELTNAGNFKWLKQVSGVYTELMRLTHADGRLGVGTNAPGTTVDIADVSGGNAAALALRAGQSATVSAAGSGRIRYNASTNKLQYSENGSAYADLSSSGTITSVDNIAALRAGTFHTTYDQVILLGYNTNLDKGGGPFYWDSASTAADNGGTIIRPTAIGVGDPGRWKRPLDNNIYDVRQFGAVGDGVTDDLPAFQAAIAAMGPAPTPGGPPGIPGPGFTPAAWVGYTLYIPGGYNYKLSDTLNLYRRIHVLGDGYQRDSTLTKLTFPLGVTGIRCAQVYADANGGRGDNSVIEGVELRGGGNFGTVFISSTTWQPSTAYSLGQVICATYFLDWGWAFKCTTAGTSGTTEPSWSNAAPVINGPAITYNDGTVVWTAIQAHGIETAEQVAIKDCKIYGFPGNGISVMTPVTALGDPTFSNVVRVEYGQVTNCGGCGIYCRGNDTNAGVISNIIANGNYGYGFRDDSFLGNTWIAPEASENHMGNFWANVGGWVGIYDEGGAPPNYFGTSAVLAGGVGLGNGFTNFKVPTWTATTAATINVTWVKPTVANGYIYLCTASGTTGGSQPTWPIGIGKTVVDGTVTWTCYGVDQLSLGVIFLSGVYVNPFEITTELGTYRTMVRLGDRQNNNSVLSWGVPDEDPSDYSITYDPSGDLWHCVYGYGIGATTAWALTNSGSPQGAGFFLAYRGMFLGNQTHNKYFGFHPRYPDGSGSRNNLVRGDSIFLTDFTADTAYEIEYWVCDRSGGAAAKWKPNTLQGPGDRVQPTVDNGHYYVTTVTGTTAATEPVWPTGSGDTVVNGTQTFQEAGTSALLLPRYRPLPEKATSSDYLLTTTSPTVVATYTPQTGGNYVANLYYRVATAPTNVTISISYTDGGGVQSTTLVDLVAVGVGSYSVPQYFFNSTAAAITITATAGTANRVYMSAAITRGV